MASHSSELQSNDDETEKERDTITISISPSPLLTQPSSFQMTPLATPTVETNPGNSGETPYVRSVETQPHPIQLLAVPGLGGSPSAQPQQTKGGPDLGRPSSVITTASQKSSSPLRGAIVLSCLAAVFCGILFGVVALIVAMIGRRSAMAGDTKRAARLRTVSYFVSIVGSLIGVIVFTTIIIEYAIPYHLRYRRWISVDSDDQVQH